MTDTPREPHRDVIRSDKNEWARRVLELRRSAVRRDTRLFLLEGEKLVEEARAHGLHRELIVSESYLKKHDELVPDAVFSDGLFKGLSELQTPEGIMAVAEQPNIDASQLFGADGLILLLDRIQDPGNVGTMIRTADAVGARAVVCLEGTADLYSGKVLRATMGSAFHLPVVTRADFAEVLARARAGGWQICAADMGGENLYGVDAFAPRTILAVGNEGAGLSDAVRTSADRTLALPIAGTAESLNAAVACGVLCYRIQYKSGRLVL